MTAYVTQADLVERYGQAELAQLTDINGGAAPIASVIAKVCDEATSLIDGYVSSAYVVPLNPVPTIVRKIACDVARKFLWKDRATEDSAVQREYDAAIKTLQDIAKGSFQLGDSSGVENQESGGIVAVQASDQVFTDDVLERM